MGRPEILGRRGGGACSPKVKTSIVFTRIVQVPNNHILGFRESYTWVEGLRFRIQGPST